MLKKMLLALLLALGAASAFAATDLVIVNLLDYSINVKGNQLAAKGGSHFYTSLDHKVNLKNGSVEIRYPKQECAKKPGYRSAWLIQGQATDGSVKDYCIQYKTGQVACIMTTIYPKGDKVAVDFQKVKSSVCAKSWTASSEAKLIGNILTLGLEAAIAAAGLAAP